MAEIKSNDLYLDSDGTLGISADVDISKVKRILLTQEGTHYGSMYYLDDSDHIAEVSKKVDADLISRRGATEALYKKAFRLTVAEEYYHEGHVAWSANVVYRDVMEGALLDLPSAQPDIIHCKDCKWKNQHNCTRAVELFIDDDKYCAWAERKT